MKLTKKQLKAMGYTEGGEPQVSRKDSGQPRSRKQKAPAEGQALFLELCKQHGLPEPDFEYQFYLGRKWRFDYLFDAWLAVEKVGGVFVKGHHSGGRSQLDDMEKRNHAALVGYVVLEFTPQQFDTGEAFGFIRRVLRSQEEQP